MKIAVFLPNWIGDAVMATPALRALRDHYVDAEIFGVMRPYVGQVLEGLDLLDRTFLYAPRTKSPELKSRHLTAELRKEHLDLAILFPNLLRTATLAWMSGANRRLGFSRDMRGLLLTDSLSPKSRRIPHPAVNEYLRLVEHLGCSKLTHNTELAVTAQDQEALDQFWHNKNPALRQQGVICLNSGGAFGAAKDSSAEKFAQLGRRLATETGHTILVLCGPAEEENARSIVKQADHPSVISVAGEKLSIGLTKAAVKESRLLVTTDSGPRHFAQPFNVPVVTLFGPTHIAWSETFYARGVHVQQQVDCGPCQQRVCPRGHHRCMTDLKVDRVFSAAMQLLEQDQSLLPMAG